MAKTESSTQPLRAAAVVAGITAAAAVVAAAARGPLSRSTPIDASSASAPVTALSFLLLGAGIVALTALGILVFRQRRRKNDPEDHASEPPEISGIWKVVAILAPFALGAALILAAVTGSKKLSVAPNLNGGFGGGFGVASGRAAPPAGGRTGYVLPAWLPWTILAIVLVAMLAGIAVLVLRRGPAQADAPEPAAAGEAVQAAIAALEANTDPRGAVIAAYGAMQRTLAAHGLVRSPSEAPREFLRRVLVTNRAAEQDAGTLTGLFEEARFSTHPITERTRERALSAFRSLQLRPQIGGAK
ncbi:MAG: DUF4129 domain-containing protein [Solirubrobacteraceae bacterium]